MKKINKQDLETEIDALITEIRKLAKENGLELDNPSSLRFLEMTRQSLMDHVSKYYEIED